MAVRGGKPLSEFEKALATAVNCHSMENDSNTPDFILAAFLNKCHTAFAEASRHRERWYGRELRIGGQTSPHIDENNIPSVRSREIAARVWCDQDMGKIVMDVDAAGHIAVIIDAVIASQQVPPHTPMTMKDLVRDP